MGSTLTRNNLSTMPPRLLWNQPPKVRPCTFSQSFSGSPKTSAIVVCGVACLEPLVLEVKVAIDRAVEEALDISPVLSIN